MRFFMWWEKKKRKIFLAPIESVAPDVSSLEAPADGDSQSFAQVTEILFGGWPGFYPDNSFSD